MRRPAILDTGPWVAILSERDTHHRWAREHLSALPVPLLTCEAVVAEACFLLGGRRDLVTSMLADRLVQIAFHLDDELDRVRALMSKYSDAPMSLADACLVRLSELTGGPVATLDRDFLVYRVHGRRRIPLIAPFT